jgi:hypothetical protein
MRLSDFSPVNTEFFVWDPVVAWRDNLYQADIWKSTKSSYLLNMLKLIEEHIIDVRLKLCKIDDCWIKEAKKRIDELPNWSEKTKSVRKSCLNSFYKFIKTDFDYGITPYQRHPEHEEIKHILSSCQEKALTANISPKKLCYALSKINERDAYIVWLMMWTGQTLEAILDRKKEHFRTSDIDITESHIVLDAYLEFDNVSKFIPSHITAPINEFRKTSNVYLFETANGKRISRTQVTRNLKQAGRNIELDFDLTPKLLQGYVIAYMSRDKRSELERAWFPLFE